MRVSMKKNLNLSALAMVMLALSGSALAEESTTLDVNFTANIRETTCDMKLSGGTGSDSQQTLTIGNNGQVRLDDIKAGNANATFKIMIVECPASLKSLKTTIRGTQDTNLLSGLANQIQKASGGAEYAAVQIARASTPSAPFTPNSTVDAERLVWSTTEIQNKEVSLVAKMRETRTDNMTLGDFQAVATFEFSYE